jgi:hypothetical protein
MKTFRFACVLAALAISGCAHYRTPGSGVSIPDITSPNIADAMARKPAATWPARIIVVRVQGPGYESYSNRGYGQGRFSVVTTRDIEQEADFQRIGRMPKVAAIGMLSRLLLPGNLGSADDLRTGAAQLQGDIVMMYTIDTAFRTETTNIGPLQTLALGFFPTHKAKVTSTCSVALLDTRTGYVYGVAEWTSGEDQRGNVWNEEKAIEKARAKAERDAFTGALGEVERLWAGIVTAQMGGGTPTATP